MANPKAPVRLGDKLRFVPAAWLEKAETNTAKVRISRMEIDVTGTVDYISETGRFFRVRYETPHGGTQHECFKF